MPYFELDTDTFSIGVLHIDEHHWHLIGLLNNAYDNFIDKGKVDELGAIFQELNDYVIYYFSVEKMLMKKLHFPGFALHKKEHEKLCQELVEMDARLENTTESLSIKILMFLFSWLSTYILQSHANWPLPGSRKNAGLTDHKYTI